MFAHSFLAHTLWHLGYLDRALEASKQALTIAAELARPYDRVVAMVYAATSRQFRRETRATHELAQDTVALCAEYGFAYYLAWATILLGWVQAETGDVEQGIDQIRRGLADFDKTGAGLRKPYYLGLLAEALGKAGRVEEGLTVVHQALDLVSERHEYWPQAELVRLHGELLLAQGAAEEAEQQFRQAIEIARCQQAKSPQLRATVSLCRLWQTQGRRQQAHKLLAEIYTWFSEGFDTPDLIQAHALLEELSV